MEPLHTQFTKQKHLYRVIMLRVWYVYLVSVLLRPALVYGFIFGASAIAFWRLASITSIATNILSLKVVDIPQYVLQSLITTDGATFAAFVASMLTFGYFTTILLSQYVRHLHPFTAMRA